MPLMQQPPGQSTFLKALRSLVERMLSDGSQDGAATFRPVQPSSIRLQRAKVWQTLLDAGIEDPSTVEVEVFDANDDAIFDAQGRLSQNDTIAVRVEVAFTNA